jgi:hypothetical protein
MTRRDMGSSAWAQAMRSGASLSGSTADNNVNFLRQSLPHEQGPPPPEAGAKKSLDLLRSLQQKPGGVDRSHTTAHAAPGPLQVTDLSRAINLLQELNDSITADIDPDWLYSRPCALLCMQLPVAWACLTAISNSHKSYQHCGAAAAHDEKKLMQQPYEFMKLVAAQQSKLADLPLDVLQACYPGELDGRESSAYVSSMYYSIRGGVKGPKQVRRGRGG